MIISGRNPPSPVSDNTTLVSRGHQLIQHLVAEQLPAQPSSLRLVLPSSVSSFVTVTVNLLQVVNRILLTQTI